MLKFIKTVWSTFAFFEWLRIYNFFLYVFVPNYGPTLDEFGHVTLNKRFFDFQNFCTFFVGFKKSFFFFQLSKQMKNIKLKNQLLWSIENMFNDDKDMYILICPNLSKFSA